MTTVVTFENLTKEDREQLSRLYSRAAVHSLEVDGSLNKDGFLNGKQLAAMDTDNWTLFLNGPKPIPFDIYRNIYMNLLK